jgi:hypothetical protein
MINPDYCDDPLTFCPQLEVETASFRFQLQMYKVRGGLRGHERKTTADADQGGHCHTVLEAGLPDM